ncbi:MAG TPA: leucyl/phenylalanyl-tRNA--protein transferase [Fimbriimonadaceae bacterium]|nr:leucyl/phenylalanyl-tRNA--protein transferase [Fimbriimonadaceae bacterium]
MLTPALVRMGYEHGAFPMANEDGDIHWYKPYQRALFPLSGIHISRSLKRTLNSGRFRVTFDQEFELVIRCCRRPTDNWINEEIVRCYTQIHYEGWAHSCEVWQGEDIVGGIYGLALGSCFSAESMFHRRTDASKMALMSMIDRCRELGFTIFDAQVMNPHLASLGAFEVPDKEYMSMLAGAWTQSTEWSLHR